jgi:hypothetical protein
MDRNWYLGNDRTIRKTPMRGHRSVDQVLVPEPRVRSNFRIPLDHIDTHPKKTYQRTMTTIVFRWLRDLDDRRTRGVVSRDETQDLLYQRSYEICTKVGEGGANGILSECGPNKYTINSASRISATPGLGRETLHAVEVSLLSPPPSPASLRLVPIVLPVVSRPSSSELSSSTYTTQSALCGLAAPPSCPTRSYAGSL